MSQIKKADLIKTAEEVNEIVSEKDKIDLEDNQEVIEQSILETFEIIDPEKDELSKVAISVMKTLYEEYPETIDDLPDEQVNNLMELGIVVVEDEENEKMDEEEVKDEEDEKLEDELKDIDGDLILFVQESESIDDLKDLIKEFDELKSVRKFLKKYDTLEKLRAACLRVLGVEPEKDKKDEPEPEEKPKKKIEEKKPVAKKKEGEKKVSKPVEKREKEKKRGVIQTIVSLIESSGKKGISKKAILEELIEQFPDRNSDSMKSTINVQVPARITKERFEVEKLENGNYRKK